MAADDLIETHPQRGHVLSVASKMLRKEGRGALSLRRVAQAAGVTTMTIYSAFGSKEGLLDALRASGFETLGAAQRAALDGSAPKDAVVALCHAYRDAAHAAAAQYRLMTGLGAEDVQAGAEAHGLWVEAATRHLGCLAEAGLCKPPKPAAAKALAASLFAFSHGFVDLELHGLSAVEGKAARAVFDAGVRALANAPAQ